MAANPLPVAAGQFVEPHFSPEQISEMWGISTVTVIRLFEAESDVMVIGRAAARDGKRKYRTLRIPAHVAERVHKKLSIIGPVKLESLSER
ncbi:MAG: hypothetical protein ACRD4V_00880 [Candidatus Acidiferrales bacterium]